MESWILLTCTMDLIIRAGYIALGVVILILDVGILVGADRPMHDALMQFGKDDRVSTLEFVFATCVAVLCYLVCPFLAAFLLGRGFA